MKNIMEFLSKSNREVYSIVEGYDESARIFNFMVTLKVLKVTYRYTNAKSNKRKEGIRYFVGNFGNCSKASHRTMLQMWVKDYNETRKYPILNVSLENVEVESILTLLHNSKMVSKFGLKKVLYDIEDVAKIDGAISILKDKPSSNKMDYVVWGGLNLEVSLLDVKYETSRGNIKERELVCISLENANLTNVSKLYNSDYNKVANMFADYNSKYPHKGRKLISVERKSVLAVEEIM